MIEKIINAKEYDLDEIIKIRIDELNKRDDKVEKLGFFSMAESYPVYKGFIPLDTRIKYSNFGLEDYGMKTTDFIYEYIHLIKKYNIFNAKQIIVFLEYYINLYFGLPQGTSRENIFNDVAWKNTTTDEEYFSALQKNDIGMLKNKGAALCTERSAVAEQILSVLGFEVYYCMGCVDLGNNHQEPHCFNIIKTNKGYVLLDYSCPVKEYNTDNTLRAFYPFIAGITNEEFADFINENKLKSYSNYRYEIKDGKKIKVVDESSRSYIVGKYEIEKDSSKQL